MPAAEVAIVGAGPVGLLAGILLAQKGVSVEILERRTHPSTHSRAIGIHPPALGALAEAGIAATAIERGVRIERGEVRCDGRVLGAMSFTEARAAYPFVLSLPQRETEALLRERLAELPGARLRRGVAVTGVRPGPDDVELDLDHGGAGEVLSASFVVGADGARSLVREAAGIRWTAAGRAQPYVMADYLDETDAGTTAVLFFERGGVVESFPLPGGQRRWVAMTDRVWTDASLVDLAGLIGDRTGIRPRSGVGAVSAFVAHQHRAQRMARGRIVLAGDSAHEISPIGGQGMNLGWLDARALVPALVQAVRTGNPRELEAYDDARRARAAAAAGLAAFNMSMGRPASGARLTMRNVAVRTLAVRPVRGVFARAFTMRWL